MKCNFFLTSSIILCIGFVQNTWAQGGSMRKVNLNEFDSVKLKEYEYLNRGKENDKYIYKVTFTKKGLGIINANNQEIYPPVFAFINWAYDTKQFVVKDYSTGNYGILDYNGKWVIPATYREIKIPGTRFATPLTAESSKVYFVKNKYGKWGTMDRAGKEVLLFNYYGYYHFTNGYGRVGKAETYSGTTEQMLVDERGRILTTEVFDNIEYPDRIVNQSGGLLNVDDELFFKVRKMGKYGVINETGKLVIPVIYDKITDFDSRSGNAVVYKDSRYGVINSKGTIILPIKYAALNMISNKVLAAKFGDKWGLISYDGNLVSSTKYDEFEEYYIGKKGTAKFKLNGKFGIVDSLGKETIAATYNEITPLNDEFLVLAVQKNGAYQMGVADYKGNIILPLEYDVIGGLFLIGDYPSDAIAVARKKNDIFWFLPNRSLRKLTKQEQEKLTKELE